MCHSYSNNTYYRNHEPIIRTEYIHNTHYENPPQNNITLYRRFISWHIPYIVVYKNCYWVLHDFLLGGVDRPAYVRRDPPVHVVRFVRYVVTTIGDYYALLRSRFALCLCGFLPRGFAAARHIGKRRMDFYVRSPLFASTDYGKTPTIQPPKALLQ